ncbi:hypothetical protein [Crocinitomix catalasitica]|uniref:hypothetical protein n=1 Tax=Crocinitomix catalasitica TaxID=184607 RepID=UPI00055D4E5D|nr:hypothetical protein [Crocinitomix catalasitica]
MHKKLIFILFTLCQFVLFGQAKMTKIAELDDDLEETSGLVLYQDNYFISHNDGGNKAELFILDLSGKLIKKIKITNADNDDWEDIAQDNKGNLYIGDFGNNDNKRKKCQIYILKKGFIKKGEVEVDKISFSYEDQKDYPPKKKDLNFDCEAMIWKDDHIILFTKSRAKPYKGRTNIYRLKAEPGKQEAKRIGNMNLCQMGWRFCSITAADYDKKTNTLVLLTYSKIYAFTDFEENDFWNGNIQSYTLEKPRQREAICFGGKNEFFITDEKKKGFGGGNLYKIDIK